jgi:hypothetical protein
MREETKVVYALRRNWDGELYVGLVGKLPMTFESNEEAEEYLQRHNFGSPYSVAVVCTYAWRRVVFPRCQCSRH